MTFNGLLLVPPRCLGGPKVFSRATRGAVQALGVAGAFKTSMIFDGTRWS